MTRFISSRRGLWVTFLLSLFFVIEADGSGANLFLQKPLSLKAFTNTLRDQGPAWLNLTAPQRS